MGSQITLQRGICECVFFFLIFFCTVAGKGKGTLASITFQGGYTPEPQTDSASSEDDDVRRRGHVSRRDRAMQQFVDEFGRYHWQHRRGRQGVDGAGSSAGPTGPVNQFHLRPPEHHHHSPAQQDYHHSPIHHSPAHHHSPQQQQQIHHSPIHHSPMHHSPIEEMPDDGPLLRDMHLHISGRILTKLVLWLL